MSGMCETAEISRVAPSKREVDQASRDVVLDVVAARRSLCTR